MAANKVDAVAEAFALRVDDLTAKHRMMGMQLHAAQARLHFLEQEKLAKQRELAQVDEKAALLQSQLVIANETLHRVKRDISRETTLSSRARSDEPRLLEACRTALCEAEGREGRWQGTLQRVAALERKWNDSKDCAFLRPLTSQIASLDQELLAAEQEETTLVARLEALQADHENNNNHVTMRHLPPQSVALRSPAKITPLRGMDVPSTAIDSATRRRLEDELALEKRRVEDEAAFMSRNLATVVAEIGELNTKATSLDQWIEETRAAHAAVVALAAAADEAMRTQLCAQCAARR